MAGSRKAGRAVLHWSCFLCSQFSVHKVWKMVACSWLVRYMRNKLNPAACPTLSLSVSWQSSAADGNPNVSGSSKHHAVCRLKCMAEHGSIWAPASFSNTP